jgi:hypothetical protein
MHPRSLPFDGTLPKVAETIQRKSAAITTWLDDALPDAKEEFVADDL